jgi:hypothetical protein
MQHHGISQNWKCKMMLMFYKIRHPTLKHIQFDRSHHWKNCYYAMCVARVDIRGAAFRMSLCKIFFKKSIENRKNPADCRQGNPKKNHMRPCDRARSSLLGRRSISQLPRPSEAEASRRLNVRSRGWRVGQATATVVVCTSVQVSLLYFWSNQVVSLSTLLVVVLLLPYYRLWT